MRPANMRPRTKKKGPRPFPAAALNWDVPYSLPGLGEDERDRPAIVWFQDVHRRGVTAARTDAVFERRMLIHQVRNNQLDTQVLQVVVGRGIARIIANRQIEGQPRGLDVGVASDQARECTTGLSTAGGRASIVYVRRIRLRVEEVRLVVGKTGHTPGAVAPSHARTVTEP